MQPLAITLKGFRGIRDGLGLDELSLDLERLADGASLVAIAGANGRGKSTLMDNLHPYLTMPSRAAQAGPGGFSYYDQVCLPESQKDLLWAHGGRSYRSQVVIRTGGRSAARRKTEAYLLVLGDDGAWHPAATTDGTVSDGKVETYTRCVEAICGPADTFFTSVFSAQGKRPLSAYRNGEIKTLLGDLLGQEEIRVLGSQASDTARLLKATLAVRRSEDAALVAEQQRLSSEESRLNGAAERLQSAEAQRVAAQLQLESARAELAARVAEQGQAAAAEARRQQVQQELADCEAEASRDESALRSRERALGERQVQLAQRVQQRQAQELAVRRRLQDRIAALRQTLQGEAAVARAERRLPVAAAVVQARGQLVVQAHAAAGELAANQARVSAMKDRVAALEREAGQAALHAEDLARRVGLSGQVPCAGLAMQGACQLLADAREAHILVPGAQHALRRLAEDRQAAQAAIDAAAAAVQSLAGAPQALQRAELRSRLATARHGRLLALAARSGEMAQARAAIAGTESELAGLGLPSTASAQACLGAAPALETPDETAERRWLDEECVHLAQAVQHHSASFQERLASIQSRLDALPPPFDPRRLEQSRTALGSAQHAADIVDQALLVAVREEQSHRELVSQLSAMAQRREALRLQTAKVEQALANWLLFARCMGNDGLIALAIDDAGPTLSSLVNDLLLACYGPRFTVVIETLQQTAKGEQREGFDIRVHDAETGESKSVSAMSGGERVWINEALVRAVALYLAQNTGRSYDTLFSDESDGALDPDRKRMFMAMKRQVLALGGYAREYFVSQTPELSAMADVVIDLDALATSSRPEALTA